MHNYSKSVLCSAFLLECILVTPHSGPADIAHLIVVEGMVSGIELAR